MTNQCLLFLSGFIWSFVSSLFKKKHKREQSVWERQEKLPWWLKLCFRGSAFTIRFPGVWYDPTLPELCFQTYSWRQKFILACFHVDSSVSSWKTLWLVGVVKNSWSLGDRLSQVGLFKPSVRSKSSSCPMKLKLGEMLDFLRLTKS